MKQTGISLVELVVSLMLLAIVVTGISTSFSALRARHAVTLATNNILGLIYQARAQGMSGGNAYLCDGQRGCGEFDWTTSLVVTTSPEPNAEVTTRLRLPENITVRWNGFRGKALHYGPRGHTFFQNGHLLICHSHPQAAPRKIVVNWLGRPRVEDAPPEHCGR